MFKQILRMTNCAKPTEMLIANEFYLHREKKHLIFKQKETNKTYVMSKSASCHRVKKQRLSSLKKVLNQENIHKNFN